MCAVRLYDCIQSYLVMIVHLLYVCVCMLAIEKQSCVSCANIRDEEFECKKVKKQYTQFF